MESFALGCGGACAIRLLNWNTCIVIFWGEKASILIFHIFFTEIYVVRFFFLPCILCLFESRQIFR